MRRVRVSKTFARKFDEMLADSEQHYGPMVSNAKRQLIIETITNRLAKFPRLKQPNPELGLVVYPVSRTPFALLYDYDDTEPRVHMIVCAAQNLGEVDPTKVAWQSRRLADSAPS